MFYKEILRILSQYLFFYTMILLAPFLLAGYYQFFTNHYDHPQPHSTLAFGWTIGLCWCLALICRFFSDTKRSTGLYRKEALATAVLIWFLTPALGSLPFILSGTLSRFDQAYFEAASGFTTTGATVLEGKLYDPRTNKEIPIERTYCGMREATTYRFYGTVQPVIDPKTGDVLEGIEAVSRALLFWRSLMQWVGGMGVIFLFIMVLPALGMGGKVLFHTETPGPIKEGLTPRIKETALQLWKIYVGLTILECLLLRLTNSTMPWLDSVTIAFSTLSTGGFSLHDTNIAYYQNTRTDWVILFFMFLGSINFAFYYQILKGKFYRIFEPEFLLYIATLFVMGTYISWHLIGFTPPSLKPYSFIEAIRIGFFQLVSAQTSSGFFIANYDVWPYMTQVVLLIVMFFGGMASSTSGGIKMIRLYMLVQIAKHKIESVFRPKMVRLIRVGNKTIDETVALSVLCFFFFVIALSLIVTFLYIQDGIDPETALGLTASMVNNTGMAFRAAGPASTVAFLSPFSTCLSSFVMILGRLEFYAVLVILLPAFWKNY